MSTPAELWRKGRASLPSTRRCGSCDLCCSAMGVDEPGLEKAAGCRCPHQLANPGRSCAIYKARPPSCSEFTCAWLASDHALPRRYWPARAGWVMAVNDWRQTPLVITVHPDPARPTAWDTAEYRAFFSEVARKTNAVVAVGQGVLASTLFAPRGAIYTKELHPELFIDDGMQVGLPDFDFFPFDTPPLLRLGAWLNFAGPAAIERPARALGRHRG